MKRLFCSLINMLMLSFNLCAFANYDNTGVDWQAIGSHIGRISAGGNDNKIFWYRQGYDFNKIKTIILTTNVSENYTYVSDPYLKSTYIDTINKKFEKNDLKFIDGWEVEKQYTQYLVKNNLASKDYSILAYVYDTYKTTNYMQVNIYAYRNRPYPGIRTMGDCWLDFKLIDVRLYNPSDDKAMDVLFYNDQRLDAVNASKGGLLNRITGKFKEKFDCAMAGKDMNER